LSLATAPTCAKGEVKLAGTLDGVDQTVTTSFINGFWIYSVVPTVVDFDIGGTGHVHVENDLVRNDLNNVPGTFVSPMTGEEYCVQADATLVKRDPLGGPTGAQVFLSNATRGACPGTEPVRGAVAGCFDDPGL
jgi:hypothetical protein